MKITIYGWSSSEASPRTAEVSGSGWKTAAGWCILAPLDLGAEGGMGMRVVTVNDVLDGHVALDIECRDRIYLNAYVPTLQTSAQVAAFLTRHLGFPFPSPALFKQLGDRFRRSVRAFADAGDLPG